VGYRRIINLYSDYKILSICKTVYAMEKIHGTSSKVGYKEDRLWWFSGGCTHERFVELFDHEDLLERFRSFGHGVDCPITIYGEAYGAKIQKMRTTYGNQLRFVAFEAKVDQAWLAVPNAADVARKLGLDFVPYVKVPCTLAALDWARDAESKQAIKNGMGPGLKREGVVIRPLEELRLSNGDRLMAKHKADAFRESRTKQPRPLDPAKQLSMAGAQEYVDEYVVKMRLLHVLDAMGGAGIKDMAAVIRAMTADVITEEAIPVGVSERDAHKALGRATAVLFKQHLKDSIPKV